MRAPRVLLLWALCLGATACFDVNVANGKLPCSTGQHACPEGYQCQADDRCWRLGSGPDLVSATMPSDLGDDLAESLDAAEADLLPAESPDLLPLQ